MLESRTHRYFDGYVLSVHGLHGLHGLHAVHAVHDKSGKNYKKHISKTQSCNFGIDNFDVI